MLAFWILPARVDLGLLLLVVCIFYCLVAVLRTLVCVRDARRAGGEWRAVASAGAVPGWAFFQHPQVWLIPIALSILVAAQLNRRH